MGAEWQEIDIAGVRRASLYEIVENAWVIIGQA
jgi:hypothetical protein